MFEGEDDARRRLHEISHIGALFSLNRFLARKACTLMCAFRSLLEEVLPRLEPDLPPKVVLDALLHDWPAADGAFRILLLRPWSSLSAASDLKNRLAPMRAGQS